MGVREIEAQARAALLGGDEGLALRCGHELPVASVELGMVHRQDSTLEVMGYQE
jgi:hypothetical protein